MPRPRLSVRFRKKLTVIGIIGQMHGVNSANNPPMKQLKNINHKEPSVLSLSSDKYETGFHKGLSYSCLIFWVESEDISAGNVVVSNLLL